MTHAERLREALERRDITGVYVERNGPNSEDVVLTFGDGLHTRIPARALRALALRLEEEAGRIGSGPTHAKIRVNA